MPAPFVTLQGVVGRKRPMATPIDNLRDGLPFRSGRYGEEFNLSLIPKNHLLADEGSYFIGTNPTAGTAVLTLAAQTAVPVLGGGADVNPYFVIVNAANPADGTRVYLDYMNCIVSVAGTNNASANMNWQLDVWSARQAKGAAVGGTSIVPVNVNQDDTNKSVVQMWAGANTVLGSAGAAGAGSNVRQMPHRQFRQGIIMVAGDVFALTFGGSEQAMGSLPPNTGPICQQTFNYPPIVLGPGHCALGFFWFAGQTVASSFIFDIGWWER